MSRIRNRITVAAGAASGLFLTALASSAIAAADTAPLIPGFPGVEQMIASSAGIPQQLLQSTTSALTGAQQAPAAPAPIASATVNLPQTPAGLIPGAVAPAAPAAGAPAVPGLQMPANLSSLFPFPLPNLGGTSTAVTAPTVPTVSVPGAFLPSVPVAAPGLSAPIGWMPVSGLP